MFAIPVSVITTPLLVGAEAKADALRISAIDVPPPETGRPETAEEFAKRIERVRLVVKPIDEQEGRSGANSQTNSSLLEQKKPENGIQGELEEVLNQEDIIK